MNLVLFDIDGTLLRCGRQVGRIFFEALEEIFDAPAARHGFSFAGKTDPQIVMELMTAAGVERSQIASRLPLMQSAYLRRLEEELEAERMTVLAGVLELLTNLAARQDVVLGLLTGNWERGARTKLSRVGLEGFFCFGAFGDDAEDRRSLPPVALDRASRWLGSPLGQQRAVIVGDTELDVDCALCHDIPILAVASGTVSFERLEGAGANRVVRSLEEVSALDVLSLAGSAVS